MQAHGSFPDYVAHHIKSGVKPEDIVVGKDGKCSPL